MPDKLIFAQTFEGLLRSLSGKLTPQLVQGMRERGVDAEHALESSYPMETFIAVVHYLAGELHPALPLEEGVAVLGRGFLDGFGETMIGRAMLAMLRIIGPHNSLKRLTQEFRTGNNYSETRLVQRGERSYDLWVNELRMPGWYVGVVSRGLELAGARGSTVQLQSRDAVGGTFRVEWTA
ncbi:MAG: DUF2378 family protein [Archangium sp.]|nr:DUF2378 family protein [Archangium sp.]